MSDDSTTHVLDQADALIRRRRIFVAAAHSASSADEYTQSMDATTPDSIVAGINTEPELPLLTEIVTLDEITSPSTEVQLASAIHEEIRRWLDEELPDAVLKITDGLADQLVQKLTFQAENELLPRVLTRLENPSGQTGKRNSNQ
jgi:hypothetical protein